MCEDDQCHVHAECANRWPRGHVRPFCLRQTITATIMEASCRRLAHLDIGAVDIGDSNSTSSDDDEQHTPPLHSHIHSASSSKRHGRPELRRPLFAEENETDSTDEEEDFQRARQKVKARSAEVISTSPTPRPHKRAPPAAFDLDETHQQRTAVAAAAAATTASAASAPSSAEQAQPQPQPQQQQQQHTAAAACLLWASSDVLGLLASRLDLASALSLASTCCEVNELLLLGDGHLPVWARLASELGVVGVARTRELTSRELVAWMRDAWLLRPGDCLEVMDTYRLWAVARVVAVVGDLLFVHFDGYSVAWLMWLHRSLDRWRIRELSRACPSTANPHTARSWHRVLGEARRRLSADCGHSVWRLDERPDGERADMPAAYRCAHSAHTPKQTRRGEVVAGGSGSSASATADGEDEERNEDSDDASSREVCISLEAREVEAMMRAPVREFVTAREYSRDRALCRSVYTMAVRAEGHC